MHVNLNENLGMQLEELVDPLPARAAKEEGTHPERIDLPPVPEGWNWGKEITATLKEFEALWHEWSDASAELMDAHVEYDNGRHLDDLAIAKAARDGAKQHPGRKAEGKLRDDLEWALAVCTAKREKVNQFVRRGDVPRLVREQIPTLLDQLEKHARTADQLLEDDLEHFRRTWAQHRGYALAVSYCFEWLGDAISSRYGVIVSRASWDPIPELKIPYPREVKLNRVWNALKAIAEQRVGR